MEHNPWMNRALGILVAALWYITGVIVVGKQMLPGGSLFEALVVYVAAAAAGKGIDKLGLGLPPLIGMLLAGFVVHNIPVVGVGAAISLDLSKGIRYIALAFILSRAGLGVDLVALRRLLGPCLRLSFIPCTVEAVVISLLARGLLDMDWVWCFMLGFVMAAISPAVVVPTVLALQEQGYGVEAGVTTMVVAATALDSVYAISGFGICLALAFDDGGNSEILLRLGLAAVELVAGTVMGLAFGTICSATLPPPDEEIVLDLEQNACSAEKELAISTGPTVDAPLQESNSTTSSPNSTEGDSEQVPEELSPAPQSPNGKHCDDVKGTKRPWWRLDIDPVSEDATRLRSILLLGFTLMLVTGGKKLKMGAGGTLAAVITSATAAHGWKKDQAKPVSMLLAQFWYLVAKPMLFGLIGASVDLSSLKPDLVGKGVAIIVVGGLVRFAMVSASMVATPFTMKERIFVGLAWIPKATVQAALGAMALDEAREQHASSQRKDWGSEILAITVLAILIAAPLGAMAITLSGPKLLKKT
mmetsp:Transcript_1287/g.2668  ORF Transcript_1287/g.2668 Transcript_1287/m.2668 type:complete len:530 (+) Transcript_1287:339-1928(+)